MYSRRFLLTVGFPGIVWIGLFIVLALYTLLAIAFGGTNPILLIPAPHWNPLDWGLKWVQHMGGLLVPFQGRAWSVFIRSCIYIALALAGCIAIGYPVAYYVALHARRSRNFILVCLLLPFLFSYMLRLLAWVGILAPDGWFNLALLNLGFIHQGVNWLSGRPVVVVLALIYGWIPYFIIPMYAALARFDRRFLEASYDLGGVPSATFFHVTLPLSRQGLLASMVIVALPMFGDFFTTRLVSGTPSTSMVGTLLNAYRQSTTQQSLAAAGSVWLMVFLGLLLIPYLRSSAKAIRELSR